METLFEQIECSLAHFKTDRPVDLPRKFEIMEQQPFLFPNQYLYVVDNRNLRTLFVSSQIQNVLGYSPKEFNFKVLSDYVHGDDVKVMAGAVFATFKLLKNKGCEPFKTILTLEYRVRHANGHCVKIQRQSTPIDFSKTGNLLANLSICTDISAMNNETKVRYSLTGPGSEGFHVPEIERYKSETKISKREQSILQQMAKGLSSIEIAEVLHIAKSTVDDHRRNMLRKTGFKNSIELVVFGIQNDWINY